MPSKVCSITSINYAYDGESDLVQKQVVRDNKMHVMVWENVSVAVQGADDKIP